MRKRTFLSAAALGLAALLLPAGLAGTMAGAEEIIIETDGDIPIESFELEGLDSLDLNDLVIDLEPPEPDPTEKPAPTKTPAPTKAPKEEPRWISSVHYPREKVFFDKEIWSILTKKWGLKDFQAAGLMSSLQAESSFCPYNVQGMGGSDDRGKYIYDTGDAVGFGLAQWTSSGRKAALLNYAKSRGSADLVWDFDTQMGYMARELDMSALKATGTLYEAAEWAVMRYERPNQKYANSWPGTRYERGLKIFKKFTGEDYEEPELRFSVTRGGDEVPEAGEVTLEPDVPATLTVTGNYYWRLTQVDATAEGWLEIRCPSFYYPTQTEPCVCGYPCEGAKVLTLSVATPPEPGETYTATLRFEIYRGQHEIRTVKVSVTGAEEE